MKYLLSIVLAICILAFSGLALPLRDQVHLGGLVISAFIDEYALREGPDRTEAPAGRLNLGNDQAILDNSYASVSPGSPFTQDWTDINLIVTGDTWIGVVSMNGFLGNLTGTLTGVDPQTILYDEFSSEIDLIPNQTNPNTQATGGVAEFELANPVVALQGSGTADAPSLEVRLNTTACSSPGNSLTVTYDVRDIDGSSDNAIQPLALQYRLTNIGTYTNIPAGFIADATTGPSLATLLTPMSVTLPAATQGQSRVHVRWITTNAVGNDEWIGIDNINVSCQASAAPAISVSPNSLSFGNQPVATTSSPQQVTVTNTGTANLELTAPTFGNGANTNFAFITDFSVPIVVAPNGGTATIEFTYTPDSAAPDTDSVTINSNAPGPPVITLSGNGIVPGTLGFDPSTYAAPEGSGTVNQTVEISVMRDGTGGAVTVDYGQAQSSVNKLGISMPGTGSTSCAEGVDYIVPNGTLTWADGESGSKTFDVMLCADTTVEPAESFHVSLFNATGGAGIGASTANVTILNDDTSVQFSAAEYADDESQSMDVVVMRAGILAGASSVTYTLADGTAERGDDCSGDADLAFPASGTIDFAADQNFVTLTIPLCSDTQTDLSETFTLTLSDPTGATLGAVPAATGTIRDTASQHRFTGQMTPTANYPATINVASGPSNVGSVKVTLFDLFYDGNPTNIDVLLVAPDGRNIILMADTSDGTSPLTPTTITFSDQAGQVLPDDGPLTSGTFEPTSYGDPETSFPSPAPAGPYNEPGSADGGTPSMSSVFAGTSAVGNWRLFIRSDAGAGFQRMGGGEVTIAGGWGLQLLAPSAAPATISGRVSDVRGRAVGNATVSVQGGDGIVRRFTTNSFGYYRFDGLAAGASYVVSVNARRHTFESRVVSVEDNIGDLNFVALP